jgi:hypothetical protein
MTVLGLSESILSSNQSILDDSLNLIPRDRDERRCQQHLQPLLNLQKGHVNM